MEKLKKLSDAEIKTLGDYLIKYIENKQIGYSVRAALNANFYNLAEDVKRKLNRDEMADYGFGVKRYKDAVATASALPKTGNEEGDGRVVLDDLDPSGRYSYVHLWDGKKWGKTPLIILTSEVVVKSEIIPLEEGLTSVENKTLELITGGIDIGGEFYPFALVDPTSKRVSFAVNEYGQFVSFAHLWMQDIDKSMDDEVLFGVKDANGELAFAIYKDGTSFLQPRNNDTPPANPFPQFSDINYILLNGQSLGAGEQSFPAITVEPSEIGTLMHSFGVRTWINQYGQTPEARPVSTLIPIKEDTQETIGSGFVNSLKSKLLGLFSNNDKDIIPYFIFSYSGQGGRYLRELDKRHDDAKDERAGNRRSNGGYYIAGIDDVKRAKAYADSQKKTFSVTAVCWMQGEAESAYMVNRWDGALTPDIFLSTNKADYENLIEDYMVDVVNITKQKVKPLFLCYKTSGWISGRTQYELMLEDKLTMVAPLYILPMAQNAAYMNGSNQVYGDPIHLANDGERWLGEQFAKVLRRVTMDAENWKPLHPVASWRSEDRKDIFIRFHVPCPPLVFDTNFVVNATNLGFYISQTGYNGSVSSILVVNSDTIKISMTTPLLDTEALLNYGHWQSQNTLSKPILEIKDGAATATGFPTTDFIFEGDITQELVIAQKDGTFRMRNASGAVAIVRKVSFDGTNTLLNVENREKGALAVGDNVFIARFRSWGNLRDSDNELSLYEFADPANGRTGRYPLWNWCIDFLNFKI